MIKNLKCALKYTLQRANKTNVAAFATQSAFFIFLSIFPALMLVISISARFVPDIDRIMNETGVVLPFELQKFLNSVITDIRTRSTGAMSTISIVMLVWSSSTGIYSLWHGLELVTDTEKKHGYIRLRLLAFPFTALLLAVLALVFLLFVAGDGIISRIFGGTDLIFIILKPVLGFVTLSFLLALIYRFLTGAKHKFRSQLSAGTVCAFGWIVFSYFFRFYVDNFAAYSRVYGSITAVILLMLWLYACMYMLFVGAILSDHFASA